MGKSSSSKRQRRVVLTEDEYSNALQGIVERDYFPDLPELRKQVAVLDRRSENDFAGAVHVRQAARRLQQHNEFLAEREEEDEGRLEPYGTRTTPRPLDRESLTGFHDRAASEDNHDFEVSRKDQIERQRKRLRHVFSDGERRISKIQRDNQNMMTPSKLLASDQFAPEVYGIDASTNPAIGNGLFFSPSRGRAEMSDSPRQDGRHLLEEAEHHQLMPPPSKDDSVKRVMSTPATGILVEKKDLIEFIPKKSLVKKIEPSQTRFQSTSVVPQRSYALNQTEDNSTTHYSTDASTDLDSFSSPLSRSHNGKQRIQNDRDILVAMTPVIIPGRGQDQSPLTTWGQVNATPMRMENTGSQFQLSDESERDKAARRAESKIVCRRKRVSTVSLKAPHVMPTALDRVASLTPAARALLAKSTPSSVRSRSALTSSLRASYTPKPSSSSSFTHSKSREFTTTPRIQKKGAKKQAKSNQDQRPSKGNITDGLLALH